MDRLRISSVDILKEQKGRFVCPKCQKSMKYYCYNCVEASPALKGQVPSISLPVAIDMYEAANTSIKHDEELDGKSTAYHAKLVAPSKVTIYNYPSNMPVYADLSRVVLMYPSDEAERISDIDLSSFDRIVVIDGTWSQSKKVIRGAKLGSVRKVSFAPRETLFWRYQPLSPTFLSTIEAIYYSCVEYMSNRDGHYDGSCDDLLWFFKFFYELIQLSYRKDRDRSFHSRHMKNYIKYEDNKE